VKYVLSRERRRRRRRRRRREKKVVIKICENERGKKYEGKNGM